MSGCELTCETGEIVNKLNGCKFTHETQRHKIPRLFTYSTLVVMSQYVSSKWWVFIGDAKRIN